MRLTTLSKTAGILTDLERQRHLMMSMQEPSVMKTVRLHDQAYRNLMGPVSLQALTAQSLRMQQLIRPSVLDQLTRQQMMLDQLVRGPAVLASLSAMSSTVVEQAKQYRDAMAAEAEEEELNEGSDPLPRLAAEREAILSCIRRIQMSLGTGGLLGVPIPHVILALILIAVVLGEVADERLREREDDIAI